MKHSLALHLLIVAFVTRPPLGAAERVATRPASVDFSHQIVPLLRKHCADCHMGDKRKGGFSMNDRAALLHGSENGAVVEPGKPENSLLWKVVTSDDKDERMPPKGEGLSREEAALLRQWIADNLPWEAGFAFKSPAYEPPLKPRSVTLPPVSDGRTNPVDRLVDAYFTSHKLPRPSRVADGAFLRRAHLDLIGLLPTPKEVADFAADTRPDKRGRLVAALLARDVDYAEHWLTFWNDLLRNDYVSPGKGLHKQISKWLYESLVSNKPFDQFTREIIAPRGDDSRGFIDGIKWRGDISAGQTVEIQFAQSVAQSFLGINLKCASCHDSFVDRWKLDEAYGLAAIYAAKPLEVHRCDKPTGRPAVASWLFPELGQVDPKASRPERLSQLAALMTHPDNGRLTRTIVNRLWHRLMGRGIVHPLDSMASEPWSADLLDYLASDLQANGYDLKKTLSLIASSEIYQGRSEVVAEDSGEFVFKGPRARRLTAEQFVDAVWQLTDTAPTRMDAPVLRGKPDPNLAQSVKLTGEWIWGSSAANGKTPPAGEKVVLHATWNLPSRGLAATAIVACDNEFTVYLNGRSVAVGDNSSQIMSVGLKNKFIKGDNDITVIARNSESGTNAVGLYFQAQAKLADGREVVLSSDASWQFSPKAPTLKRRAVTALPKNLEPATVVQPSAADAAQLSQQGPALLAQGSAADSLKMRAALLKSDFLMRSLGRPNHEQIVTMRPNELTTLEALDLFNGKTLSAALDHGADLLVKRRWSSNAELVSWVYTSALARAPSELELRSALESLGGKPTAPAIADLLWAVLMQPEFLLLQ